MSEGERSTLLGWVRWTAWGCVSSLPTSPLPTEITSGFIKLTHQGKLFLFFSGFFFALNMRGGRVGVG